MRTSYFSGFQNRFWKFATSREVFKFSLYISVPIMSSVFYANPEFMHALILHLQFVKYPEESSKPPVGDEIAKFRAKVQQQQQQEKR